VESELIISDRIVPGIRSSVPGQCAIMRFFMISPEFLFKLFVFSIDEDYNYLFRPVDAGYELLLDIGGPARSRDHE